MAILGYKVVQGNCDLEIKRIVTRGIKMFVQLKFAIR